MNKPYITAIMAITSLAFSAGPMAQNISKNEYQSVTQKTAQDGKPENIQGAEERLASIRETILPTALVRLCKEFKRDYPDTKYAPEVEKTLKGARRALYSQQVAELTDDTLDVQSGKIYFRNDLVKALRGDKDASYRVALMYQDGNNGLSKNARRTEQWLKFSSELGNAPASWQLAEAYLSTGQQADAAKYEARAIKLGYKPPPRLSNRGY